MEFILVGTWRNRQPNGGCREEFVFLTDETQGPFPPNATPVTGSETRRGWTSDDTSRGRAHSQAPPCPVAKRLHLLESEGAAFPSLLPFLPWKTMNNLWTPATQPCPISSLCHVTVIQPQTWESFIIISPIFRVLPEKKTSCGPLPSASGITSHPVPMSVGKGILELPWDCQRQLWTNEKNETTNICEPETDLTAIHLWLNKLHALLNL